MSATPGSSLTESAVAPSVGAFDVTVGFVKLTSLPSEPKVATPLPVQVMLPGFGFSTCQFQLVAPVFQKVTLRSCLVPSESNTPIVVDMYEPEFAARSLSAWLLMSGTAGGAAETKFGADE